MWQRLGALGMRRPALAVAAACGALLYPLPDIRTGLANAGALPESAGSRAGDDPTSAQSPRELRDLGRRVGGVEGVTSVYTVAERATRQYAERVAEARRPRPGAHRRGGRGAAPAAVRGRPRGGRAEDEAAGRAAGQGGAGAGRGAAEDPGAGGEGDPRAHRPAPPGALPRRGHAAGRPGLRPLLGWRSVEALWGSWRGRGARTRRRRPRRAAARRPRGPVRRAAALLRGAVRHRGHLPGAGGGLAVARRPLKGSARWSSSSRRVASCAS